MTKNIVLIGVGGQGTILTSKVLAAGIAGLGFDIKMSEIHGMSQRGGSVSTHIRYGEKVWSPCIAEGEADIVVAFEKAEALRGASYLKQGGTLLTDIREIYPLSVLNGAAVYPESITEELKASIKNLVVLNAYEKADALGNPKAQNMVLLGCLVSLLGLENADWNSIIEKNVPPKAAEINKKAFSEGLNFIRN